MARVTGDDSADSCLVDGQSLVVVAGCGACCLALTVPWSVTVDIYPTVDRLVVPCGEMIDVAK